ncbi:unnamed protein product [Rotaria sordida]|uniref:UEV domain-containing protein n=1 Tax=Rotaria sordida TaxID=392033 RepID=A0A815UES3_9BILA|nr:unnamed protein product [Rotaria sordida]CAF1518270.1 unnamed protein product [Rotaria sordida]CAF1660916.1 unnamed protein product [Rotaria sordida]CAF3626663.1 unnamed protein product [Rotaria sordida]
MTNEILAWITDNETEFWTDHPHVSSLAYVKPISVMYLSTTSQDVQPDGTIIISYLKNWCHSQSNLVNLLKAITVSRPILYPTNLKSYPISSSSMPMPVSTGMTTDGNPSYSNPYGYS